ncbi:hypothetical protein BSK66_31300 [Paenibacillus odorifer]|uniref:Uncharacterized protein n=1 Tax=Paenibacillus odorifer TaxID=189426 RepID=A0A1R0X072_9BACL|nr:MULTISPECIES: hypothetical protein [Paenibacillus]ETT55185.1 hypothetical protein C171_19397 [Paenibacillus sp. FSL H8-237]OMD25476.1 hypothetical protein BJP51_04305 [Paenibacillus odorifer]OME46930.1 hypothetical protein BSK66_31300 [Paenibacillus odorifer]
MKAFRNILSGIMFILSVLFLIFTILTFAVPETEGKGVAIVMTLICFFLGFVIKTQSKQAEEIKQKNEELGIKATALLHHVEGLPISEKTQCKVAVTRDGISIIGGGTEFNITNSQIRAAEVKTDTEIANIVHSSAAKGIAGGLLFGPIGLVVGSRAKSKEKRTSTYYLIINYTNTAGEVAALMFDEGTTSFASQKIVSKLKPVIVNNPIHSVQL